MVSFTNEIATLASQKMPGELDQRWPHCAAAVGAGLQENMKRQEAFSLICYCYIVTLFSEQEQ